MSLRQVENNPFKEISEKFKAEPIERFQENSNESRIYLKEVQGEPKAIDPLFIAWVCMPRTYFAYLLMSMKREAEENNTSNLASDLAQAGFNVVLPQINDWISNSELPVILVPIASRYTVSERFAYELHNMLEPGNKRKSQVRLLLERIDHSVEMKTVYTWPEKARAVKKLFSVKANQDLSGFSVLLVDDFISSGFSLRESARLLRDVGAKNIAAAALATNMFTFR
jgi:predicted amidophosphoribosyltransferase